MCFLGRSLLAILNDRLKAISETKIGEYQCGFRQYRSTSVKNFILRHMIQKCNEHDIEAHLKFVEYQVHINEKYGGMSFYMATLEQRNRVGA